MAAELDINRSDRMGADGAMMDGNRANGSDRVRADRVPPVSRMRADGVPVSEGGSKPGTRDVWFCRKCFGGNLDGAKPPMGGRVTASQD